MTREYALYISSTMHSSLHSAPFWAEGGFSQTPSVRLYLLSYFLADTPISDFISVSVLGQWILGRAYITSRSPLLKSGAWQCHHEEFFTRPLFTGAISYPPLLNGRHNSIYCCSLRIPA